MPVRRKTTARKNAEALSDLIRRQCVPLEGLAFELNGDVAPKDVIQQAADVVAAALESRYPEVPELAAKRFNAFATGQVFSYVAGNVTPGQRGGVQILLDDQALGVRLLGPRERGSLTWRLANYFTNPERERLRRCPQCGKWFVDLTRNKSAVRCTRPCTVAWWNKQRPKAGRP